MIKTYLKITAVIIPLAVIHVMVGEGSWYPMMTPKEAALASLLPFVAGQFTGAIIQKDVK